MTKLLEGNLEALRRWNSRAAEAIVHAQVPAGWRKAAGADGSETYCRAIDGPQRRVEWLGATSLPAAAAASLVADMEPGGGTALGLGFGTGHAWRAMIGRLAAHQALFVYEPDAAVCRMALECCDLAELLACGRLVPVVGETAAGQLTDFLREHVGFDVPTVMHQLPSTPMDRREMLRRAGDEMVRAAIVQRTQQGTKLIESLAGYAPGGTAKAIAFVAAGQFQGQRLLADACAAERDAVPVLRADQHASTSLVSRLDAIARHRPAVVHSDFPREQLGEGIPHGVAVHTWFPAIAGLAQCAPERLPAPAAMTAGDRVVVHSAEHKALMLARGIPAERVVLIPSAISPVSAERGGIDLRTLVAVPGDIHPLEAEEYGLQLPSHQAVWNAARQLIADDPLGSFASRAGDIFRRAQRAANVTLDDSTLASPIERAIRHALIPSLVAIGVARMLVEAGMPIRLIGRGWARAGVGAKASIVPFTAGVADICAGVALFVQADAAGIVPPLLLHAASQGAAIVALEHPHDSEPAGIAAMLEAGEFVRVPGREFVNRVKTILRDASARQTLAAAGREAVLSRHTWRSRRVFAQP